MNHPIHRRDIPDLEVLELVQEVQAELHRYWDLSQGDRLPDSVYLVMANRYGGKLALAKLEHLVHRGLLDYGTSLNFPWLTPEGKKMLEKKTEVETSGMT